MPLVSLTAFAEMHGAKRQAADRWKAREALVLVDGQVDVKKSDARMKDAGLGRYKERLAGGDRRSAGVRAAREGTAEPAPSCDAPASTERMAEVAARLVEQRGPMSLADAIRLKETSLALLRQLEYDQKVGSVVPVTDVVTEFGRQCAIIRTRLLAIPTTCAPALSRASVAFECAEIVRAHIVEALEDLVGAEKSMFKPTEESDNGARRDDQ